MAKRGEGAEDEEMTRKEVKVRATWRGGNRRTKIRDKEGFSLAEIGRRIETDSTENVCDE